MSQDEVPSRQTLESVPESAFVFLMGVGQVPAIRGILKEFGYTDAEHQLGWSLTHKVANYKPQGDSFAVELDDEVRKAVVELDQWDEPNFARARAALRRRHKEQEAFVFADLEPAQGVLSVKSVGTFLLRLDALESGKERTKDQHKQDLDALKVLEARGITKAERARLAGLVKTAEQGAKPRPPVAADPSDEDANTNALVELYEWYKDWSTVARTSIKRRDYLIRLGLASRRAPRSGGGGGGGNGGEGGDGGK